MAIMVLYLTTTLYCLADENREADMLNLRRHLRPRIPNGLAVVAALTLAATSLLGTADHLGPGAEACAVSESAAAPEPHWMTRVAAAEEPRAATKPRRNAGFRVNLFLFRHY